jgi:hypothetical protein
MHKTLGAGNRKTWTYSVWIKRCTLGTNQTWTPVQADSANNNAMAGYFDTSDRLNLYDYNAPSVSAQIITNRKFRDTSAWYHFVIAVDTEQGTANNRLRFYVNGVEERGVGGYGTDTMPAEDYEFNLNQDTEELYIGANYTSSVSTPSDMYMAEACFIDGTQYAASDFGEFDEDSPTIWKPKDVSGLTFGTNGFYLDFEDSANLGNDANGGTDLTEVNLAATDQSSDSPTNNFATLNPLDAYLAQGTFSEGNLKYVGVSTKYDFVMSTIMVTSGKWYCEAKYLAGNSDNGIVGISGDSMLALQDWLGEYAGHIGYIGSGGRSIVGGTFTSNLTAYTHDDIIGMAMDLDNMKMYFAKNGTWGNSGDPTSGATGTGAITIQALSTVQHGAYGFAVCSFDSNDADEWFINFGNPPYANSSDAADANGYGAFEYAPPSGYLALCTKNLGSDGG